MPMRRGKRKQPDRKDDKIMGAVGMVEEEYPRKVPPVGRRHGGRGRGKGR